MNFKHIYVSAALTLAACSFFSAPALSEVPCAESATTIPSQVAPLHERVDAAVAYIRTKTDLVPEYAIVLGSGFDKFAEDVQNPVAIPYGDIPGFTASTAPGHKGELVLGTIESKNVVVMRGRIHLYEGLTAQQVVFPIQVMHGLGAKHLIVSNASGAIRNDLGLGELMVLKDHINMTGTNPCIGVNDNKIGPRFFPVSSSYDKPMARLAHEIAEKEGFKLSEGVYVGMLGPSYETYAENQMLSRAGGDAVGMSTVLELIEGAHCNMSLFGVTCITDVLNDEESENMEQTVIEMGEKACSNFTKLIHGILRAQK